MENNNDLNPNSRVPQLILAAVKIAGLLTMAVVAPNCIQLLKKWPIEKSRSCYTTAYINQAVKRLIDRGLLELKSINGSRVIRLTEKGERELSRYQSREKTLTQSKWDGKWRILIFDIKEYRRSTRDSLRRELVGLGFIKLQNSVWINPYPCDDIATLLKADLHIGKDLLYMTVENLENDTWIKKQFNLN